MRIDYVNGATYSPTQIAEKRHTAAIGKQSVNTPQVTNNAAPNAVEKLTPAEANLLQKLFGDFKLPDKQDLGSQARSGMFIDITV